MTRSKDHLDEQHVTQRVSDRLIDEFNQRSELSKSIFGGRRGGLGRLDGLLCRWRKEDGSVTIGLEVDADIVALRGMMEVFDTSGSASDRDSLRKRRWTLSVSKSLLMLIQWS